MLKSENKCTKYSCVLKYYVIFVVLVKVIDTKQNLEIMEKEEQRFYASEIENDLLLYTCQIFENCEDMDHSRITIQYSDKQELEQRVKQILNTLNK